MSKYNIWNKWDPLEVVMLGTSYGPEFFRDMKDIRAQSALQRIAEETQEDLEGYERILKEFGCEVIRPEIDESYTIGDHISSGDMRRPVPVAPLEPRDHHLILGDYAICTPGSHPAISEALKKYSPDNTYEINKDSTWPKHVYETIKSQHSNWPDYDRYISLWEKGDFWKKRLGHEFVSEFKNIKDDFHIPLGSANTFPIGNRLFANTQYFDNEHQVELAKNSGWLKGFDVHWHEYDGHSDGNFHPLKPGAILSLVDVMHYEETFPGWDVCFLPDQSWDKVEGFLDLKEQVDGKWWVPGEEKNDRLTAFVETWLNDWVGYVEETVFDVNVLMLDEHHCCVSNPNNEKVNAFFKKHNIEPVYVPWRHRYFWDGGLHCITLDLKRRGKQQNYFK